MMMYEMHSGRQGDGLTFDIRSAPTRLCWPYVAGSETFSLTEDGRALRFESVVCTDGFFGCT